MAFLPPPERKWNAFKFSINSYFAWNRNLMLRILWSIYSWPFFCTSILFWSALKCKYSLFRHSMWRISLFIYVYFLESSQERKKQNWNFINCFITSWKINDNYLRRIIYRYLRGSLPLDPLFYQLLCHENIV